MKLQWEPIKMAAFVRYKSSEHDIDIWYPWKPSHISWTPYISNENIILANSLVMG